MPVGTERRILGIVPIPFVNTFSLLTRAVEVHPHGIPVRIEITDAEPCNEVMFNPQARAHPIFINDQPRGLRVEQGYQVGLKNLGGLMNREEKQLFGREVNHIPAPWRRLRHTNPIIPEVIVYRRS